uniref:BTA121 domain-containing protein surface lipoprotein n=1 Tax=Borrelia persica TaxID=44448 RepID=UPI00046303D0
EYLSSIFNEFVRLRSSIDNLGNDIFRQGALYRLRLLKKNYVLGLKKIFDSSVSRIYDEFVQYVDYKDQKNNYSERLEMLQSDVLGFTSFSDCYSKLPGNKSFSDVRSILTDPEIGADQGYRTYSNDEFDALLSHWNDDQLHAMILMLATFSTAVSKFESKLDAIDDIDNLKDDLMKPELQIGLSAFKRKLRDQLPYEIKYDKVYLKGLFDKPTVAEVYENILIALSFFTRSLFDDHYFLYLSQLVDIKNNFILRYNDLYDLNDLNLLFAIGHIGNIVLDPNVVVFPVGRQYIDFYEFCFLFGGENSELVDFITAHSDIFVYQKKIAQEIDGLADFDSELKFWDKYNSVFSEYRLYVKELFSRVEDGTFDFKFDKERDIRENYKKRFADILKKVKA